MKLKHLNEYERGQIKILHEQGYSPYKIGKIIGRASNTVRNELKRGTTTVIRHYFEKTEYIPEAGQAVYEANIRRGKSKKKMKDCKNFIEYIEREVLVNKRSFDAARGRALRKGMFKIEETVSVPTLYRYCERGLLKVRNIDLPEKVSRKVKKEYLPRKHKRLSGTCIEKRTVDMNIENREEFGHWEIDLIIGKVKGDAVLLTLTERKTRKEIIRKLRGKKVEYVMKALEDIRKNTKYSGHVFKSITTDNGLEFSRLYELESKNIRVYYAHPYSSWERGSNERANRIIRRFVRKGEAISRWSGKRLALVEHWINTLPRKMFDYQTPEELYQMELERIRRTV